jgi:exopolyphosphatase/guanosine-5'-triphosphate,3'-diphosphate pyrophosphatase
VDLGGGSTELVLGDGHVSIDVGSVRLTERLLPSDPPGADELAECAAVVREALPPLEPRSAVGVAGTVTTLAALDLGLRDYDRTLVHSHLLTREAVERQLARLASMPVAERRKLPAMEPERAPVIVAGAVILREILVRYGLELIEVSERDILDGAALLAAELPERPEGDAPPGAYTCC